jgi:Protein of unknown function (DUF2975)
VKALGRGSIASGLEIALNILWVILWVALGGVVLGALAYAVSMGLVAAGVLPAAILEGGRGQITIDGSAVSFDTDKGLAWQLVAPALLYLVAVISGSLIIVSRLRRLFASFRSSEPFRKENATHLRVIWISMIAIELSRNAALALAGVLIAAFGQPSGLQGSLELKLNLSTWAAILVLIVLAEVFREGARLREEQDLTI